MKEEEEQGLICELTGSDGTYLSLDNYSRSEVKLRYEVSSPTVTLKHLEEKAAYMQAQLDELKKDMGLLKHKIEEKFEKRKRLGK